MIEETYTTKAIVLKREPFREQDTRVIFYSEDQGKLELVARGTKKISSKLAGHLEPLNLVDLMVVPGKQWDYVGTAQNENSYPRIKINLEKLLASGEILSMLDKIIKPGITDQTIFISLQEFLQFINALPPFSGIIYRAYAYLFVLVILSHLGYRPELYCCVICQSRIDSQGIKFCAAKGGVICPLCSEKTKAKSLTISSLTLKILQQVLNQKQLNFRQIKLNEMLSKEIIKTIRAFYQYHYN